jgi:hypothetical protein
MGSEPYVPGGIIAAVIGYAIETVDMNPTVSRIGAIVKNFGVGYALGSAGQKILWSSTHSNGAGSPAWSKSGYGY